MYMMIKTYILFSVKIECQHNRYFISIFFFPHLFCNEPKAIQHMCKYDLYIYIK